MNAGIQLELCLPPCSPDDDKLTFSRSPTASILPWFFPRWAQAGLFYPGATYTVGFLLPSTPTPMEPQNKYLTSTSFRSTLGLVLRQMKTWPIVSGHHGQYAGWQTWSVRSTEEEFTSSHYHRHLSVMVGTPLVSPHCMAILFTGISTPWLYAPGGQGPCLTDFYDPNPVPNTYQALQNWVLGWSDSWTSVTTSRPFNNCWWRLPSSPSSWSHDPQPARVLQAAAFLELLHALVSPAGTPPHTHSPEGQPEHKPMRQTSYFEEVKRNQHKAPPKRQPKSEKLCKGVVFN